MSANLTLLDKPLCDGGTPKGVIQCTTDRGNRWRRALDRRDELRFVGLVGPWASVARPKHDWILVEDRERGTVEEWRLHGTTRLKGSPNVGVICHPAVTVLRDMGHMRIKVTGGASRFVIGGQDLTPTQFLAKFVVESLVLAGINWIDVGTVESSAAHTIIWDRWSGLTLCNELEERTWLEFQLRRNGATNYLLDLVEQIGAEAPPIIIAERKNLTDLRRADISDRIATVVSGFGMKLPGSPERHTGALATWGYAAVTGDEVTGLFDPTGGPDPIVFDDMYAQPITRYAQAVDGSRWAILGSRVADQALVLEAGAGVHFPLGAGLQIRADEDGSFLEELADPDSLASQRVVRQITKNDLRGEAGLGNNWWAPEWSSKPEPFRARLRSGLAGGDTTVALKELFPGKVISDRSVLVVYGWVAGSYAVRVPLRVQVGGGDTADGSGHADPTVQVAPGFGTLGETNSEVIIYPEGLPVGWVDENAADDDLSAILAWRPGNAALEDITSGIVALAAADRQTLYLDGFNPANPEHVVWPGDIVQLQEGAFPWGIAMHKATPNGGGELTVTTHNLVGSGNTWAGLGVTGGEIFKILRPRFPSTVALPANVPVMVSIGSHRGLLRLPAVHVQPPADTSLRLRANVLLRGISGGADETFYEVELDGTPVGDSGAETFALSGAGTGEPNDQFRAIESTPLSSGDAEGDAELTIEGSDDGVLSFLLGASIMVGSGDAGVPIIENGAHANRIRQLEARWLRLLRQTPRQWTVSQRRLRALGIDEEPQLGGTVLLRDPELEADEELRIFEISPSLVDPLDTEITLTTRHDALTTTLERRLREVGRQEQSLDGAHILTAADL